MQRGFTLIEALVYLGLFALIMSGFIVSVANIFQTTDRTQTKAMVQEEGDFLLAKLNWAMTGVTAISVPDCVTPGSTLTATRSGSTFTFNVAGSNLQLNRGSGPVVLNNSNVTISAVTFSHSGCTTSSEFMTAVFTLQTKTPNGLSYSQTFQTTKYLRK